jgi:hypothetical protein
LPGVGGAEGGDGLCADLYPQQAGVGSDEGDDAILMGGRPAQGERDPARDRGAGVSMNIDDGKIAELTGFAASDEPWLALPPTLWIRQVLISSESVDSSLGAQGRGRGRFPHCRGSR